jgi:branched-chain amino acid transport system permease protein
MNQNQVGSVRFILVGVALMLLMIYRPQGIFGDKKELALNARA